MPTSQVARQVSADEALAHVQAGMKVVCGSLSAEPLELLAALGRRSVEAPVRLVSGMLLDGYEALSGHLGREISLTTWFMPGTLLGDVELGPDVDFLPMSWTQTYRYMAASTPDVALLQVSPADSEGFHSVGISASLNRLMAQRATVVIAEVNPQFPYTLGDTLVHESEIDFFVPVDAPLRPFPHRPIDDRDRAIAAHVVPFVPDGATIQGGIGKVPEAVLHALAAAGRRDLTITSQLTDAARALIEAGCCRTDGPAAIVGEVLGSADLYRWVDRNPAVEMRAAPDTHGLLALSDRRPFVSVNSTLEIDLFGQLNSEIVGRGQAGGIGGSVDFMMAAQVHGGTSVIALPSATAKGASRIVPVLDRGLVTIPRTLVQIVVTEHGVADLRGLSAAERTEALIGIADPGHRKALRAAALGR